MSKTGAEDYRISDYRGGGECEIGYCTYPATYVSNGNKKLCGFHAAMALKDEK